MSLRIKLTLTFVAISLISVLLIAVFIRQFVIDEFDRYVLAQRQSNLISLLTEYYQENSSWDGALQNNAPQPIAPAEPAPPADADTVPAERLPPPDRGAQILPSFGFTVVNDQGEVILPSGPFRPGDRLSNEMIDKGEPVVIDGITVATVIAAETDQRRTEEDTAYVEATTRVLLWAAGVSIVVAAILGIIVVRFYTRPLLELRAAVVRVAKGDFSQKVKVRSRDELGVLADQFNQMSDDLDRANRLRRQMTADIAHELRSPLTVIAGYLESLKEGVLKPTTERFATLHSEALLLQRLVDDLRTLSLADAGELPLNRQLIPPDDVLSHVAQAFQNEAEHKNVTLEVVSSDNLPALSLDADRMMQVLSNLVRNALRHTPEGGTIQLGAARQNGGIRLKVQDNGEGIPPEMLPNVFERFYRGDAARDQSKGETGLGLAIVRSIVEAHGGTITVQSAANQGTTFNIDLPLQPAQHANGNT